MKYSFYISKILYLDSLTMDTDIHFDTLTVENLSGNRLDLNLTIQFRIYNFIT